MADFSMGPQPIFQEVRSGGMAERSRRINGEEFYRAYGGWVTASASGAPVWCSCDRART